MVKYICRALNEATKTYNYLSDPECINGFILSRIEGAGRGKQLSCFQELFPSTEDRLCI